jgi:hypothetical protein
MTGDGNAFFAPLKRGPLPPRISGQGLIAQQGRITGCRGCDHIRCEARGCTDRGM